MRTLPAEKLWIVGEGWLAVGSAEILEQSRFDRLRNLSRCLAPRDQQLSRARELPDQPTAPVADRHAGAKPHELPQAAPEVVGLADVDHFCAVDPVGLKRRSVHCRVTLLEAAAGVHLQEVRLAPCALDNDVDAAGPRDRWELVGQVLEDDPALEALAFERSVRPVGLIAHASSSQMRTVYEGSCASSQR